MTATLPGLTVEVAPRPVPDAPLRSDIAGFIGSTRRGPIGEAVRVAGKSELARWFGGLDTRAATTYALRGYFENGGELAWVVRVARPGTTATAGWTVGPLAGFPHSAFRVEASSAGAWANGMTLRVTYHASGTRQQPEVDVRITASDEPVELFTGVPPATLAERLGKESRLVRLVPAGPAPAAASGRRTGQWTLTLNGGTDEPPDQRNYLEAVEQLGDQPEVAIIAVPDLHAHLQADSSREIVVDALLDQAAAQLDRIVVLDVPPERRTGAEAANWARGMRGRDPSRLGTAAVYHPALRVNDPLTAPAVPLRTVPASGHVAGVISRLDRERGAHHTPANTVVMDAVDLEPLLSEADEVALYETNVNLLRCQPGRGLRVWGGRTLDHARDRPFLAHRRLLHRLVRALRRAAEPLVFDINGPELRLALVRALTSVLLEAFRAGGLKGSRPAEAFRVTCDDTNNPPEQDPGLLVCEIEVAPAAPMEFIRLRLLLGQEGRLEVIEA